MLFGSKQRTQRPQTRMTRPNAASALANAATVIVPHDEVELVDVTPLDVRCVVTANPNIGDPIGIEVLRETGETGLLTGLVHWKELRRNEYELGVYLSAGMPAGLLDVVTEVRRKSNRYRCRQPGRFFSRQDQRHCDATVVNYSYDGFAMQTAAFCPIDETVTFEWEDGQRVRSLSGQVLWQIEQMNGVLHGCQTSKAAGYRIAGLDVA